MTSTPVTVAPDPMTVAFSALQPLGVPVVNQVPNPRPTSFLRVRLVGGYRPVPTQHARTLQVEAWHVANANAARLAEEALAAMYATQGTVVDGVGVYRVDLFAAPHELPDDLTGTPRFRFTVQMFLRALPD